ncbi:MAG: ATP-dependent DNA helicase RecG [Candidatus Saganbacteria bacterium]|nr:ATP-dependent DNA helicase RecG [Candidatus Saganbacteria bacterium]
MALNTTSARSGLKMLAQYLKGVGPKVAKLLRKLGIETVEDLVYFFPRDYEDRSNPTGIADLQLGRTAVVRARIDDLDHKLTRNRFSVLKADLADRTGSIQAVWFNQPFLARMLRRGMKVIVSGKVEFSEFDEVKQLTVKDYEIDTGQNQGIVPFYSLTEGLYLKKVRSIVRAALEQGLPEVIDWLPEALGKKHKLIALRDALLGLHQPKKMSEIEPARRRLAFDDLFLFQLGLALRRKKVKTAQGNALDIDLSVLDEFRASLSFKFTAAQDRVLSDILADMRSAAPMNRLVQGDVGSGKTIVAAAAALLAIKAGYQAALMAPTEILAQQHFEKMIRLPGYQNIRVELLTGNTARIRKTKDQRPKTDLLIGTHALIQKTVEFSRLGLVIIDEQHRFGVLQRADLVKKGSNPDVLVMTATPIPRSLALTVYGDLDRSVINEMPPGRTPVKTYFVPEDKRGSAYEFIRNEVKAGRQAYVVCPLVEESEKIDLRAAMDEADRLKRDIFPEYSVGLMHGRLKSEDKDRIMAEFKSGGLDILVSTTVIEVGIDVPNASVMIIEHAERFGLSQLHQLRGRIGRGAQQSYCFLLAEAKSKEAKLRLKAMIDSTDGFHIAEVDLRLRGPGDYCGTRQSGLPNFRVADIIRDEKILKEARKAAFDLVEEDINSARNIWKSQGQKAEKPASGATFN